MKTISISIDDMSPHPQSSVRVLDQCYKLMDIYSDIKFTLFIPMVYTRLNESSYDIRGYKDFCNVLHSLPKESFEFGWHGVYHGLPKRSNNDEFRYMKYSECKDRLELMIKIAKDAGTYDLFKPLFRPSAFRISPESFRACREIGMDILALSRLVDYGGEDKRYNKVVYYDCNPPHIDLFSKDSTEIVYHAYENDKNCLNEKNANDLMDFLEGKEVEFIFMSQRRYL